MGNNMENKVTKIDAAIRDVEAHLENIQIEIQLKIREKETYEKLIRSLEVIKENKNLV
jgi:hypothetical protein